ncbi:MAG: ABC transporter ATP-binding protein/permease [Lachnospiraceae bacterium]|nr:ABC transporter ATP-binding protein/permease [Lachnospiraceae bacterium]
MGDVNNKKKPPEGNGAQNRKSKKLPAGSGAVLKKVLRVIGGYKLLILLSMIFAAGSVIIQLYIPILFGDAIDLITDRGIDLKAIGEYLTRILILTVISSVVVWVMNLINNRLAFKTVQDIRAKAIRQIQQLPLSYLDRCSTGDVVQRVIADTDQLADGLLLGFNQLFAGVVTIVVTLVFMLSKNVIISLMVLVMTPVSFLVAKFISSRTYSMFGKQTKTRGSQTALINEVITNQKVVKAFGCEDRISDKFAAINAELKKYSRSAVFYSSLTNPSTRAVNNVIYALVALVGAFKIIGGGLSVGGLTVLLAYANQYMKPFNDISSVITELQNALACADRVFELIEAEPQIREKDTRMKNAEGLVDIDGVDFSYVKDKPLIENFTFRAVPGTTTAIVGPTGCGKTTFINLLMRFYDVDKGTITVDGQDIREVTRHSLRQNYGMVLQETWLKDGTVRDNIAFGKPDATDEEIIRAAKDSHCWEFIRRMPGKLDCVVRDDSLSQGQKQLLCIARVMLCRPPMLILDEATSSIDTRTELQIQEAFAKLMKGRTSFIVAHRLSTIHSADNILVMQAGKIMEQGNHDTLMKKGGFYTNLYNSQFAGE